MKLEHHIALSALVSGTLHIFFKSWGLSIASLISGILIDIDHIFDYMIEYRLRFNLQRFLTFFYEEKHKKITLLFHGWEWLALLALMAIFTNYNQWVTGALIGYSHHIISDYFYSRATIKTYSLIWRWKMGFNSEVIFPRGRGYSP